MCQTSKKAKFPMPIHLLDILSIPVNACKDHWFSAHLNLANRQLRFLDSYEKYSASEYTRHEMLMWKFYRLAWAVQAQTEDPPSWAINPEEVKSPHELLTGITQDMKQKRQVQQNPTVDDNVKVLGECTVKRWKKIASFCWNKSHRANTGQGRHSLEHLSRTAQTSGTEKQHSSRVEYTHY